MTRLPTSDLSPTVGEVVRRLVERFRPARIILFGSHAHGAGTPHSDIDLLVVTPVQGSRRELAVEMDRALIGVDAPVDLIVATPEDVDRQRDQIGTVIRPALQEGIVVYERTE